MRFKLSLVLCLFVLGFFTFSYGQFAPDRNVKIFTSNSRNPVETDNLTNLFVTESSFHKLVHEGKVIHPNHN